MPPATPSSVSETLHARTAAVPAASPVGAGERLAVAAALLLSAALQLANLGQQGLGNPYYAATVRSMLLSPGNALFASYDPAGWVSVDKPPVGFWVQALSAKLLGYGGTALLLPQALAAVASVALAWALTRRAFGALAGSIAALVMALTPIAVAAGRTNGLDPLLVFVLLLAAWALFRALDRDSAGWLLVSAALIGLGFEVKMLQAWLILPAWAAAWWLGSRYGWSGRLRALLVAGTALLVVSFAWPVAVELTPPDSRPWVGSSSNDSVFDLAVGYNGLQRLLPPSLTGTDGAAPSPGAILTAFGAAETGARGPLRLFNGYLAAQIAWLLPLAALGWLAAWREESGGTSPPLGPRRTSLVFWGGWLLTCAAFFSVANQFHRYYLTMLGPPIAVLCGAGLAAMSRAWRRGGRGALLLPAAVLGSAALAAWIAAPFPQIGPWVRPVILAAGCGAALLLLAGTASRTGNAEGSRALAPAAVALGLAALLLGPTVWSGWSVVHRVSNTLPAAGPGGDLFGFAPPSASGDPGGGPPGVAGIDAYQPPDPALVAFLEREHAGERFRLATGSAISASPLIIDRAMPVAALGGFIGQDPIVDVPGLRAIVARGEVRFFLVPDPRRVSLLATMLETWTATQGASPGSGASPLPDRAQLARMFLNPRVRWISETCRPVPPAEWQSPGRAAGNPLTGLEALYDCAPAAR